MQPIQKNELPVFVPHSIPNRLSPLCASIVSDNTNLFLELFNNKRIPIRSNIPQEEFPRQVEVIQTNEVGIPCTISALDLSLAIGISAKKISLLFKRGHINLYLACMREFPFDREDQIDKRVQLKLAKDIECQTRRISAEDFCLVQNQCNDLDNQKRWQDILNRAQEKNPSLRSVVITLTVFGKKFRIEYRARNNIHLRLKKNVGVGTANLLSLHVDVFSGILIAKNKYAIGIPNPTDKRRKYTCDDFIQMAHVVTKLHNAAGVIPHLKSPEFSQKGDKAYLFTEFFPEGDLFDKVLKNQIEQRDIFRLLKELCGIVGTIHSRGCIHRDIKPENVFLKRVNNVWKMILGDLEFTETKQESSILIKGTVNYFPPEMVKVLGSKENRLKITPAVDIYALGLVAHVFLFKQPPLWNDLILHNQYTIVLDMMKCVHEHELVKTADPRIRKVLLGLLNFDPLERMSLEDAAAIFDDLYCRPP